MDVVVGDVAGDDGGQVGNVDHAVDDAVAPSEGKQPHDVAVDLEFVGRQGRGKGCLLVELPTEPRSPALQLSSDRADRWASLTTSGRATSCACGNAASVGPAPKKWSGWPWVMKTVVRFLPESRTQAASRSPSAVVIRASTRSASVLPAMRLAVVAGHVACCGAVQPGGLKSRSLKRTQSLLLLVCSV